jgi:hypothetical protein
VIRYGILDDCDVVVRWVWECPGPHYRYITQRVPPQRKRPAFDWAFFELAPF